jgi:hypothetical protein
MKSYDNFCKEYQFEKSTNLSLEFPVTFKQSSLFSQHIFEVHRPYIKNSFEISERKVLEVLKKFVQVSKFRHFLQIFLTYF